MRQQLKNLLSRDKIRFFSYTNLLLNQTTMKILLVVAGALLIMTFSHGCSLEKTAREYQAEMEKWKGQAAFAIAQNTKINKIADSLNAVVLKVDKQADSLTKVNMRLRASANTQRVHNDSLLKLSQWQLPDTCQIAIEAALGFKIEADTLRSALVIADTRDSLRLIEIKDLRIGWQITKNANDSLLTIISTVPYYTPAKLFNLIPLPSRKQSFMVGFITGIIATGAAIISVHR